MQSLSYETGITEEEQKVLVASVVNAVQSDVISREDMVLILKVCRDACDRRIAELRDRTKPEGPVQ